MATLLLTCVEKTRLNDYPVVAFTNKVTWMAPMEGRTVSHYRIVEKLGGGGMGIVYKAEDLRLKRMVALKFLPPEHTRDAEAKQRLVHEAQAASALDHANICTVHEIDETPDGQLFLAMAYYAGETLKQRIARGPLEIDEAIDIGIQVAQGLARAHESGIVHRDIKPANIMLGRPWRGEDRRLRSGEAAGADRSDADGHHARDYRATCLPNRHAAPRRTRARMSGRSG